MAKKVLVAYGTRYGATEKTANDIANALKIAGLEAKVADLKKEAPKVGSFDAVVVGSGIAAGNWTGDAKKFLRKNREKLGKGKKPLAVFVSCGKALGDSDGAKQQYITQVMEKEGIRPDLAEAFPGIYDFSETSKINFIMKAIMRKAAPSLAKESGRKIDPKGKNDLRDLSKIRRFAKNFAALVE